MDDNLSHSSTSSIPPKLDVSRSRHFTVFSSPNSDAGTPSSAKGNCDATYEQQIQHLTRTNSIISGQLDECLRELENFQSLDEEFKVLKADRQRLYSNVSAAVVQNSKLEQQILEYQSNEATLLAEIQRLRVSDKLTLCNQKDLLERDSAILKAERLENRCSNLSSELDVLREQFSELSHSLQEAHQELSLKNKEHTSEIDNLKKVNAELDEKLTTENEFWRLQLKEKDDHLERQRQVFDQIQANNLQTELIEVTRRNLDATKNELQTKSEKLEQATRALQEQRNSINHEKAENLDLSVKNNTLRADLNALRVNVQSVMASKDAEIRQLKCLSTTFEQNMDSLKADVFEKSKELEAVNLKFKRIASPQGWTRRCKKKFCEWSPFDVESEIVLMNLLLSTPVRMDENFEFDVELEDVYLMEHIPLSNVTH